MSIYRDPAGNCWTFEFSRRIDGARVRAKKRLPASWSRAQADAFDRRESARLYDEATGSSRRWLIDHAVATYLRERIPHLKHGLQQLTEMEGMLKWYEGQLLADLPTVCARYTADNTGKLAPATIMNRLRYLTAACRWGWKHHGMGDGDPAARVVMPVVKNARQTYIDRGQMLSIARKCRHWETRAIIRVAFYTGMRFSEIVAARIEGGVLVLDDTKNGQPRRVPIHPRIRPLLIYAWPPHARMSYYWREACVAAGFDDLHFHDLRHSAATSMLSAGVPLPTVGAVLGHLSAASTRRYAHFNTALLTEAVGRIGQKLTTVKPESKEAKPREAA